MEWRCLRCAERHTVDHGPLHYCNLTENCARLKNLQHQERNKRKNLKDVIDCISRQRAIIKNQTVLIWQ